MSKSTCCTVQDVSSNPQKLRESQTCIIFIDPALPWGDRRQIRDNPLKLVILHMVGKQETLFQTKWKARTNTQGCSQTPQECVRMYTHKHTHNKKKKIADADQSLTSYYEDLALSSELAANPGETEGPHKLAASVQERNG